MQIHILCGYKAVTVFTGNLYPAIQFFQNKKVFFDGNQGQYRCIRARLGTYLQRRGIYDRQSGTDFLCQFDRIFPSHTVLGIDIAGHITG